MARISCGIAAVVLSGWALGVGVVVIVLTRAPADRLLDW